MAATSAALSALGELPCHRFEPAARRLNVDVPGRKWQQIEAFAGCKQLAIAPCCYNRIQNSQYQALSIAAKASGLQLSLDDLALPLSETVTAGARVRRQRDSSKARRLAFDLLQRQLRGSDQYLPTPSLPSAWLAKPFADYCRDLAALKDLSTDQQDWPALEAAGWKRLPMYAIWS